MKIQELRDILKERDIDGFLFGTQDEYINEYIPDYAKRLEFLTNFSGSYGFVVILQEKAAIFVDGRYTIQANNEVDKNIFDIEDLSLKSIEQWLLKNTSEASKIAINLKTTTIRESKAYSDIFTRAKCEMVKIKDHLVDEIWDNQPSKPCGSIYLHLEDYGSISYKKKIKIITDKLKENKLDYLLITALDNIAWLLNVRGRDINFNPIFLSKVVLDKEGFLTLFIDKKKLTQEVLDYLKEDIFFKAEEEISDYLLSLQGRIGLDSNCPVYYFDLLQGKEAIIIEDFCQQKKNIKNAKEVVSMFNANLRDSKNVIKLFYRIYKNPNNYNEISIAEELEQIRKEDKAYKEPSFPSIVAINENGALPHYQATEDNYKDLDDNSCLLLDCGAQYVDGTTDMTRTISFKAPSSDFKKHYTLVLKGHIAIANLIFREGTKGNAIDLLARKYLWQEGLDFQHGTGHGIGFALCVHEGGVSISPRGDIPLQEGNILANEPAVYLVNKYGIRLENIYVVEKAKYEGFLCFKPLIIAPFESKCIDYSLLEEKEKKWLDDYHQKVLSYHKDSLTEQEYKWLEEYIKIKE